jgi:hypothetical protein
VIRKIGFLQKNEKNHPNEIKEKHILKVRRETIVNLHEIPED